LLHLLANWTRRLLQAEWLLCTWREAAVDVSPSTLLFAVKVKVVSFRNCHFQASQLTCSLMMLGSNGSSQKADVEASLEHRQHLRASTANGKGKQIH